MQSQIVSVTLHRLAIPLRHRVEHAAAARKTADPLIVRVELGDGTTGYGETLARPYVTGETPDSVAEAIEHVFVPELLRFRPKRFPQALELTDSLPMESADGNTATAARSAMELALLDAYSRQFRKPLTEIAGWMGLPGLGAPGSAGKVRYSGVLASKDPARIRKHYRLMRLYGLRDFKLKMGFAEDSERIKTIRKMMGRALSAGRVTLRLDANGAWDEEHCRAVLDEFEGLPLVCIEQPLAKGCFADLGRIRDWTGVPIMLDESVVTRLDAEELIEAGVADWFNLRVAKHGGLMPTIRLAALARRHGVQLVLGSLVGETSILTAAGRKVMECVPGIRFAEGSFGRFLLEGDVTRVSLRFGYGGRWRPAGGLGLGGDVLEAALERWAESKAGVFRL